MSNFFARLSSNNKLPSSRTEQYLEGKLSESATDAIQSRLLPEGPTEHGYGGQALTQELFRNELFSLDFLKSVPVFSKAVDPKFDSELSVQESPNLTGEVVPSELCLQVVESGEEVKSGSRQEVVESRKKSERVASSDSALLESNENIFKMTCSELDFEKLG